VLGFLSVTWFEVVGRGRRFHHLVCNPLRDVGAIGPVTIFFSHADTAWEEESAEIMTCLLKEINHQILIGVDGLKQVLKLLLRERGLEFVLVPS